MCCPCSTISSCFFIASFQLFLQSCSMMTIVTVSFFIWSHVEHRIIYFIWVKIILHYRLATKEVEQVKLKSIWRTDKNQGRFDVNIFFPICSELEVKIGRALYVMILGQWVWDLILYMWFNSTQPKVIKDVKIKWWFMLIDTYTFCSCIFIFPLYSLCTFF